MGRSKGHCLEYFPGGLARRGSGSLHTANKGDVEGVRSGDWRGLGHQGGLGGGQGVAGGVEGRSTDRSGQGAAVGGGGGQLVGERTVRPRRSDWRTGGLGPFVVREESYVIVRALTDWTGEQ